MIMFNIYSYDLFYEQLQKDVQSQEQSHKFCVNLFENNNRKQIECLFRHHHHVTMLCKQLYLKYFFENHFGEHFFIFQETISDTRWYCLWIKSS